MNTCLRHAVHCTRISKIDITPAGHRYNFHQNWTPIMRVLLYNSTTNDHYGPCTNPSNIETANWLAAWEHISGHHALTQLNNLKPKLRALQSRAYRAVFCCSSSFRSIEPQTGHGQLNFSGETRASRGGGLARPHPRHYRRRGHCSQSLIQRR